MNGQTDVVTFGEAMVRLSPPSHLRLQQASSFDVHVGGSELNVAVAASALGLTIRYVTRLPRNPIGHLVENKTREHGIDTRFFSWSETGRVGAYYLEFGASPRPNSVVYDREHSAMAQIKPGDIDWNEALRGAKAFHTSGITPALSESATATTLEAVKTAHDMGVRVSVDLNYRVRLWSENEAESVMREIVGLADVLVTTEEDTLRVFGIEEASYDEVARVLAKEFDLDVVAITLRETPSVWRNKWSAIAYERKTDTVHTAPTYDIEVVDRVGSGDSFAGGFLYGWLEDGVEAAVRYGVAISAIKQTLPGDVCWTTAEEVNRVLEGGGLRIVR
jgi:2-dehydro-3-deoxygluconokinase